MSSRKGIKKKKKHTRSPKKKRQTNCGTCVFNVFISGDRSTPEHKCEGRDSRKEGEKKEKRYQPSNLPSFLSWCPQRLRAKGNGRRHGQIRVLLLWRCKDRYIPLNGPTLLSTSAD